MNNPQKNNQAQQPQEPQQTEAERIQARKRHVINALQTKFSEAIWVDRLLKICGGDESRIMKSLNSFLNYILNDDGGGEKGKKKYIADCSISSICSSFLEAFQMGIEVGGGRDHAYLVNYAGQCELEISYKGFVYALGKHFDNPFVVAENVFEGDEFKCQITDSQATYSHIPKDPFSKSWEKLKGCYCYFSYTQRDNKERVSRIVNIQKTGPDGLETIRSKAKGSFAWNDFPFEQTKKSTLRRAIKIPFAEIDFGDEEINPENVDNKHFQLEGGSDPNERLKLLMDKQREMLREDDPKEQKKLTKETPKEDNKVQEIDPKADGEVIPPEAQKSKPEDNQTSHVTDVQDDNFPPYDDIDNAEFSDPEDDRPIIENKPASEAKVGTESALDSQDQTAAKPAPNEDSDEWDGKTLIIAGRVQKSDFPSANSALVYLKKVMNSRNHKETRKKLIEENPKLIAALIKSGQGSAIQELHKIADQGV